MHPSHIILAFHLGCDPETVLKNKVTQYRDPNVFLLNGNYYCVPTEAQLSRVRQKGFNWVPVGVYWGRTVFESKSEEIWNHMKFAD